MDIIRTPSPEKDAHDAVLQLCLAVDKQDWDSVATLISDDFNLDSPDRTLVGSDALLRLLQESSQQMPDARFMHILTNILVKIEHELAHVDAYQLAYRFHRGNSAAPVGTSASHVSYRARKINGIYKVASLTVEPLWTNGIP